MRVEIKPHMLEWARERSAYSKADVIKRFPKYNEWQQEKIPPTLKQLEDYAKFTHVPVGYLFLSDPPVEKVPIPDFRTIQGETRFQASPDLLETIYLCQQRQEWYQYFAKTMGDKEISFVGSMSVDTDPFEAAATITRILDFDIEQRMRLHNFEEALRDFVEKADQAGILVMCNGVVGNNNHRPLNPDEFRGFALVDKLAPLVFLNGKDTKAAQIFTLAHEIAHIWIGQSAISDVQPSVVSRNRVEKWCNRVAAEILVPIDKIKEEDVDKSSLETEIQRLAKLFKVSTLVIIRRLYDARKIDRNTFHAVYEVELKRLLQIKKSSSGGDFYNTQASRVSKRFARALVSSTLEGQTLFKDALRLLNFTKMKTFNDFGRKLGVMI